ncbi:hypothetical protein MMC07_009881 [Pseudocyphellaria aurata]|nr:hypothetical protein [Pseudocyphellaria aurata]
MAFQAPNAVANIASISSEAWPSMKSTMSLPWRHWRGSAVNLKPTGQGDVREQISRTAPRASSKAPVADLPECLASVPMASLRSLHSGKVMGGGASGMSAIRKLMQAVISHPQLINQASSQILNLANPFRHAQRIIQPSRFYTTHPLLKFVRNQRILSPSIVGNLQKRSISGNSSQNLLAHMEQTANNNPTSPTAQNAFYSALLRAEMPAIIVERYQTGRYATNTAVETTYKRALERMALINAGSNTSTQSQTSTMTSEQLQAVGQAIAASSQERNVGIVSGKTPKTAGLKDSPMYVVVDETTASVIFKWVKFFFNWGLVAYLVLIVFTFAVEATGVIKKVGGITNNNEAQPQHQTVRFSDVHGCDEAKEELQELVEFLKSPEKFSSLGGKLPKGVLLVGPPGTGKTLLARAVAGESGVPFFFMSGAEFDEIYVGVGAKRVRDLFNNARQKAPAIIFIDELDAIGGKRNERDPAYVKQSLNQLLTELDGFSQETGVIIIAATNFPQLLDKALTRPGRFDRNVVVPLPDVRGRVEILKHHMKKIQVSPDVDETLIARGTPGFSGAELENLVNQAAVRASRNKSAKVGALEFDWAKDKIMMGAERRSAVIQEKDKIMTAYHEGGHALVALFNPHATPVYKATIMPRGQALGITTFMPEMDKVSMEKREFLAQIDVAMGGVAAEEIVYGPDSVTSGCASDLQKATSIAYSMVARLGMSKSFGSVDFHTEYKNLSSETKLKIEDEVRRIIEEGRQRAIKTLTERRRDLDLLAKALVDYEELNEDEIRRVIKGEKLSKLTTLPNIPIKVPEFVTIPPPTLGGSSPGGGGNGEFGGSGGMISPGGPSQPGGGGNGGLGGSGGMISPGGPSQPGGGGGANL